MWLGVLPDDQIRSKMDQLEDFIHWLKENGSTFDWIEFKEVGGERGVHFTRPLLDIIERVADDEKKPENEDIVLASLPKRLVVNSDMVLNYHPIGNSMKHLQTVITVSCYASCSYLS